MCWAILITFFAGLWKTGAVSLALQVCNKDGVNTSALSRIRPTWTLIGFAVLGCILSCNEVKGNIIISCPQNVFASSSVKSGFFPYVKATRPNLLSIYNSFKISFLS